MGLDMYLTARTTVSNWATSKPEKARMFQGILEGLDISTDEIDDQYPTIQIDLPLGYWRKANQIHEWFVHNNQEGVDNCGEYYVSRVSLEALHLICGQVMDNPRMAEELLPIGHNSTAITEYNQWYFEQVADTRKILRRILDNEKFMDYDLYYSSSW